MCKDYKLFQTRAHDEAEAWATSYYRDFDEHSSAQFQYKKTGALMPETQHLICVEDLLSCSVKCLRLELDSARATEVRHRTPLESEKQEPARTACIEARFCICELTKCGQEVDITSVRKSQNMDGSCSPSTVTSSGSRSCDTPEVLLFACNICSFRPINPVETACGHLFCWPCMHRLLRGQAKPCPVCATLLSSEINVAPITTNYGSLMLYLPTVNQQVERNEDVSDGSSTNVTVVVPGRARVEATKDVLILYMGNKRIRRQIQRLQRRVHRAKRLLRKARNEHESVPISTEENMLCEGVELLQWRARRRAACLLQNSERRHAN